MGALRVALLATFLASASALQFRADGSFKVVQFTDLHFGERDELDAKSQQVREMQHCVTQPALGPRAGAALPSAQGVLMPRPGCRPC